jgi:hypothetical protein
MMLYSRHYEYIYMCVVIEVDFDAWQCQGDLHIRVINLAFRVKVAF